MNKYTVIVHYFGLGSYDEYEFDDPFAVFDFVASQEDPCEIFRDGKLDKPTENEAITDWLARHRD